MQSRTDHALPRLVIVLALAFLGFLFWAALPEEQAQLPEPAPSATPTSAPSPTPEPLAIMATTDDLNVELELATLDVLEGTVLPARLTIRNNHLKKDLRLQYRNSTVLLANGRWPEQSDWYMDLPGEAAYDNVTIKARQSVTVDVPLLIPRLDEDEVTELVAWGELWYELDPASDGLGRRLEVGPLAVHVRRATPEEQLSSRITVDQSGWTLQVMQYDGRAAPEAQAALQAITTMGNSYVQQTGPITAGWATGSWDDHEDDEQLSMVRVLVDAPGFSSEIITASLGLPNQRQSPQEERADFQSVAEAEQRLGFELAELNESPAFGPLALRETSMLSSTYIYDDDYGNPNVNRYLNVTLRYTAGDGREINLTTSFSDSHFYGGFGSMYNSRQVALERSDDHTGAELYSSFGTWSLSWNQGYRAIHLGVAGADFSQEEVLELARHVSIPPPLRGNPLKR